MMANFGILLVLFTALGCKSLDSSEEVTSLSSSYDAEGTRKDQLDFDSRFKKTCEKISDQKPEACQTPIVKLACETNLEKPDRAIFKLLMDSDVQEIYQDESIRPLFAKYVDDKLFAALKNCDQQDFLNEKLETPKFVNWLADSLSNDANTNMETVAHLFDKFFTANCNIANTIISQIVATDKNSSCIESNRKKLTELTSDDGSFCKSVRNEQQSLFSGMGKEATGEFLKVYLKFGLQDACITSGRERVCDFIYASIELQSDKVHSQFAAPLECKAPYSNNSSIKAKTRLGSKPAAKWFTRECCLCQISFYKKSYSVTNPEPLSDELLGVINHLGELQYQGQPVQCSNSERATLTRPVGYTAYYDYLNFTDCGKVEVVGTSCPFQNGERLRRIWRNDNPAEAPLKAPAFDPERAPTFLQK